LNSQPRAILFTGIVYCKRAERCGRRAHLPFSAHQAKTGNGHREPPIMPRIDFFFFFAFTEENGVYIDSFGQAFHPRKETDR